MPVLDGFHLPGLDVERLAFDELSFADDVAVRVPRLDGEAVRHIFAGDWRSPGTASSPA